MIIVIGVGNAYRHDDGVGLAVAGHLRRRDRSGVTVDESDGEPTSLMDLWAGADLAVIVDAVEAGGEPGRIHRLCSLHPAAASGKAVGFHNVSLGAAAELARALGRMPRRMLFYGVQVLDLTPGIGLTPAVATAADRLAAEIGDVLDALPVWEAR